MSLFPPPQELRDQVYGQLLTHTNSITVSWSRLHRCGVATPSMPPVRHDPKHRHSQGHFMETSINVRAEMHLFDLGESYDEQCLMELKSRSIRAFAFLPA